MNWEVLLPVVGVAIAPALAYLVSIRQASGRIDTTEAATLWAEAERMRTYWREDAEKARSETAQLRENVTVLRAEIAILREELTTLRAELTRMRTWSAKAK